MTSYFWSPVITALAGLIGVVLGGAITVWSRDKDRRQARIREKLDKFYAPLLGIRMQVLAKSEVRAKVSGAAGTEWASLFRGIVDPGEKKRIEAERWPAFEALIKYDERQLKEELVPLYNQMAALFAANMQFAEESTREYFGLVVQYTEIWNRALHKPMPPEVALSLKHREEDLYPFYNDLDAQFRNLRKQLES